MSLKTLDAAAMRLPGQITAERRERVDKFVFPDPDSTLLRSVAGPGDPVLRLEEASFGYTTTSAGAADGDGDGASTGGTGGMGGTGSGGGASTTTTRCVLTGVTAQISTGSRVAVVGDNGAGKVRYQSLIPMIVLFNRVPIGFFSLIVTN